MCEIKKALTSASSEIIAHRRGESRLAGLNTVHFQDRLVIPILRELLFALILKS